MTAVDTSAMTLPPAPVRGRRFARYATPYLLGGVGSLWLIVLFLIPLISQLLVSLMTGNIDQGYQLTWNWSVYRDIFVGADVNYLLFLGRSLLFGATATIITIVVAYPVAYFLAFRASARWKNGLLLLIMLSFFVSFIIRTNMWVFLLGGQGPVLSFLRNLHLVGADAHVLGTAGAVIGGMAYNDLAFMVLPIYVALERIDPRLFEAAQDLYGNQRAVFFRTTLPLSRSGIFAGILLVFIDTVGDPVNPSLLGGQSTYTLGQAIQNVYLTQQEYNVAAALSTIMMIALGIILFAYARVFGTDNIEDLV
ncbi:ABC transporter permease [Gryllotalpicola koreensis]|uniref:ABC transporter permease subunit n=1 Tax=Gryllotalpicola koreensis TaxID=993086 RepID=A0ABP8A717_9MICO